MAGIWTLILSCVLATLPATAQTVPDTLAQRLLACAACHGKDGEGLAKNEYYQL